MFTKPSAVIDVEAQPFVSKQAPRGLMAATPASLRNLIMDKNNHPRPIIRWRAARLRPVVKDGRRKQQVEQKLPVQTWSTEQQLLAAANPLRFLQQDCPQDVLPLVLAFCGPQTAAVLQQTNRHWFTILQEEATWKVLCKELYKVCK